jgi:acyl-coenzyme A thioesterase PaaI-like protein
MHERNPCLRCNKEHSMTDKPIVPFSEHARIEVLDRPGCHGSARIPDLIELTNHFGTVHGAALFAVGEVAAAIGMTRVLGRDGAGLRSITRQAKIDYLKPARGVITADATVEMRRGEILTALETASSIDVPIRVTLTDSTQLEVARLAVGWFVGRPRAPRVSAP